MVVVAVVKEKIDSADLCCSSSVSLVCAETFHSCWIFIDAHDEEEICCFWICKA